MDALPVSMFSPRPAPVEPLPPRTPAEQLPLFPDLPGLPVPVPVPVPVPARDEPFDVADQVEPFLYADITTNPEWMRESFLVFLVTSIFGGALFGAFLGFVVMP